MKSALGTIIVMLSLVITVVLRRLIFTTRPAMPLTSTRSPMAMGRSAKIMMPLTKLLMIFCRPKPTPTLMPPAMSASELRSMPTNCSAMYQPMTMNTYPIIRARPYSSDSGKSVFSKMRMMTRSRRIFSSNKTNANNTPRITKLCNVRLPSPILMSG